jgi:hypothetical protein
MSGQGLAASVKQACQAIVLMDIVLLNGQQEAVPSF